MEKLDWTLDSGLWTGLDSGLDWTGLDWTGLGGNFFLGWGGGGGGLYYSVF